MPSPRRKYPYYKVQTFEERSMTWRERKAGFDTLKEAKQHVAALDPDTKSRIVLVDENGYHDVKVAEE